MVIVYWVLLTITGTVALFYRSRAKYYESLFELSKGYETPNHKVFLKGEARKWEQPIKDLDVPKFNKDGSIAKKRGRKPKLNK